MTLFEALGTQQGVRTLDIQDPERLNHIRAVALESCLNNSDGQLLCMIASDSDFRREILVEGQIATLKLLVASARAEFNRKTTINPTERRVINTIFAS